MILIQDLLKEYDSGIVNNRINLTINKGRIFGLLGPNGAGKTTLLRMLATITQPDSGLILFNGEELSSKHVSKIGYMPEERGLYKKMSVLSQLQFFGEIKGLNSKAAKEKALFWLNKLEIESWKTKKMEELSKGMAQKVQFLCTILHEPEFLILDEPFTGFDPVNADLFKDLILELNAKGTTILFSSHRMDNVEELCDDLAIINNGSIVLSGNATQIRRNAFKNEYIFGFSTPKSEFGNPKLQNSHGVEYLVKAEDRNALNQSLTLAQTHADFILFKEDIPSIHDIFVKAVSNN